MKLFYRKYGSGPNLIILHGLYGSSDNWVTIARKISSKYTVILPDLRNHGQSPHNSDHNYDVLADDIFELSGDLGINRCILVGHSMGGRVAMNFALRWPAMIEALFVVDISPFGSTDHEDTFYKEHRKILGALLAIDLKGLDSRDAVESLLADKIDSERTRGFLMKNLTRNSTGSFEWKLNAESLLINLPNITGSIINEKEPLPQVTGFPVYFIKGDKSEYIKPDEFDRIMKIFPAAELITVKNAGHWIHADQPAEIERIFLSLI